MTKPTPNHQGGGGRHYNLMSTRCLTQCDPSSAPLKKPGYTSGLRRLKRVRLILPYALSGTEWQKELSI